MSRSPLPARFFLATVAALLGSLLLLSDGPALSLRARAQPLFRPSRQTLTPQVYIPLVMYRYSAPKRWSGVHLGNRNTDWNSTFLQRVDPALGGQWPAAVVVLSPQVYQINRFPDTHPFLPCRIDSASVRHPVIFDYLKRAAQAGVRVVIRLWPSPGNIERSFVDGKWHHHLSPGIPVGPEGYCRPDLYRSKGDLGDEMGAIHYLNESNGFSEFGFEPANEPNNPNEQWYTFETVPPISESTPWLEMDAYFSAVYDYAHLYYPGVRVFTPPMAQGVYAEGIHIEDVFLDPKCEPMLLDDRYETGIQTGYDALRTFYETKNDGVSWHNYWILGKESYDICPYGQHVSRYFPGWMKDAIRNNQKPAIISEADLASPGQEMGNPLYSKWSLNAAPAADSIRHFFDSEWEFGGGYHYGGSPSVASWLLTDDTGTPEHDWHKAYSNSGNEWQWFNLWYLGGETWP